MAFEPRREVRWFARHMERKLKANDRKGGWQQCRLGYLQRRLTEERRELDKALKARDPKRIINEAADVANFAMMIADHAARYSVEIDCFEVRAREFRR